MDKCTDLCWLMVNQSPRVCLDEQLYLPGDKFDRVAYRSFKQSGKTIECVVLPALYLCSQEGFMIAQGVAKAQQEVDPLRSGSSSSVRSKATSVATALTNK